jgi:hypothetical protein
MGYELHITRREFWARRGGPDIDLQEWLDYLARDPEFRQEPSGSEGYAIYMGASEEWPFM